MAATSELSCAPNSDQPASACTEDAFPWEAILTPKARMTVVTRCADLPRCPCWLRRMLLVHGLSARTGVTGGEHGRTVWAEIAWDGPGPDASRISVDPEETAIRDGEQALARLFAGVSAWFGRATREWWALAGPGE